MSRSGYRGTLARQAEQEAARVQADVARQNYGIVWIVACIVIVGLAVLAVLAVKPMSREEVGQSILRGRQAVEEGRAAPVTVLVPERIRICAYAGECYSWGGTPQLWHKTCIAPILVIIAIGTFLYTLMRLLAGR